MATTTRAKQTQIVERSRTAEGRVKIAFAGKTATITMARANLALMLKHAYEGGQMMERGRILADPDIGIRESPLPFKEYWGEV